MPGHISVLSALLWTVSYFGVMLLYTGLDVALWRRLPDRLSRWVNLLVMAALSAGYLFLLYRATHLPAEVFRNITAGSLLLALGCGGFFYALLDRLLDPFFEKRFPGSEAGYQKSLDTLASSPIPSFLHVCVLAPVVEEALMRGFVLCGLQSTVGAAGALLLSAALFALLHFNMVQTLSAFLCGLVLGLLYLYTGSLFCCILAHCEYNAISYILSVLPNRNAPK